MRKKILNYNCGVRMSLQIILCNNHNNEAVALSWKKKLLFLYLQVCRYNLRSTIDIGIHIRIYYKEDNNSFYKTG